MKKIPVFILVFMFVIVLMPQTAMTTDPVPIPCKPEDCKPIDPCKLAPERCEDKGGPIKK